MSALGSQPSSVQGEDPWWGTAGSWLCGSDSLPRLRARSKESRFHLITAIPLYPGQLCETDEMVTW